VLYGVATLLREAIAQPFRLTAPLALFVNERLPDDIRAPKSFPLRRKAQLALLPTAPAVVVYVLPAVTEKSSLSIVVSCE
jgi:hypothetical protein